MKKTKNEAKKDFPKYMMGTIAEHKTGKISRTEPSLCVVDRETKNYYVGNWVEGFGFIDVKFPKNTTRDLTKKEINDFNGKLIQIGGGIDIIITKEIQVPKTPTKITTKNSVYLLGEENDDGKRSVLRKKKVSKKSGIISKNKPLEFNEASVIFLERGKGMCLKPTGLEGEFFLTSKVLSIRKR